MKRLIILSILCSTLLTLEVFASVAPMPLDWVEGGESVTKQKSDFSRFDKYMDKIFITQEALLEKMDTEPVNKGIGGFKFNQMKTDLSVSRSGILGFSSVKAKKALEITWKKKSVNKSEEVQKDNSIVIKHGETDLDKVKGLVFDIAKSSGKVSNEGLLERNIEKVLNKTNRLIDKIELTQVNNWALDGVRLDLNISASGDISLFTSAKAKVRIRLEWKVKKVTHVAQTKNSQSKFIKNILVDLNKSIAADPINKSEAKYKIKKVNIGFGISKKTGMIGLWKTTYGYIGFLRFVPVKTEKAIALASDDNSEYTITDNSSTQKGIINWFKMRRKSFRAGMKKSYKTTKYFADKASQHGKYVWKITGLKSSSSISRSGFFGLSSVTSNGTVEIELKRIN